MQKCLKTTDLNDERDADVMPSFRKIRCEDWGKTSLEFEFWVNRPTWSFWCKFSNPTKCASPDKLHDQRCVRRPPNPNEHGEVEGRR